MGKFKVLLPLKETFTTYRVPFVTVGAMLVPIAILFGVLYLLPRTLWIATTPTELWAAVTGIAAVMALAVTLGVGMVAWYGLRSLRLSRHDMVTRATRESRTLSLARAEQFSQKILGPEHSTIGAELHAANVPPFNQLVANRAPIFEDAAMYDAAKKWWSTVPPQTQNRIRKFMNDLEAWAMYFTQGLADSEIVFKPIAPTYCSIVLQYSPWVIVCRREDNEGYYSNVVKLFQAWRAELDVVEQGPSTEAALRASDAFAKRQAQLKVGPALGTKVDI